MSRRWRIFLAVVATVFVGFVGAPWVYINVIREPAAESFLDEVTATSLVEMGDAASTTVAEPSPGANAVLSDATGTWSVTAESQVGYRVDEVLFGQNVTAVGRTNAVTGTVTIDGLTVTAAEFSVDMTTVRSDEPKRDAQFESRIMDVINYPTATFTLTSPITVDAAALSVSTTHSASGTLTLRGTSKPVDVTVVSTIRDGAIVLVGEIEIVLADWGIPNPSIPGISTEDRGILEFNLVLER
jgi:polyisoprenoid-binding protein YceI